MRIASVATAFPSGLTFPKLKLQEVRAAVRAGADEIDMVINRGQFLAGEHARIFDEIAATKDACGFAHLFYETGVRVGMKPAGGIRTAKEALGYLVMVKEVLGDDWLTPEFFRFGASTLLNDLLMQLARLTEGNYQATEYFSLA